jgi:hypothetical protein
VFPFNVTAHVAYKGTPAATSVTHLLRAMVVIFLLVYYSVRVV